MLFSKLVNQTVKESPSDIKILSHILLNRAGFIKLVANGIYTLTPPAQLMALNIENIIREEMNRIEGQEVKFPVVMPRELWDVTGRYASIGAEMARFKDRSDRDMLLGLTHEEAAVHLCKNIVTSHNQLPFMIYQIQTKFRDEPRCRGGLIRVREFTMKDAYSFHMTQEDLDRFYYLAHEAYERIFKRIGLKNFISVKSDTGMMGGSVAHEFMLITDVGEDTLVLCDECGYKANMEVANCSLAPLIGGPLEPIKEVFTGDAKEVCEVAKLLGSSPDKVIKAVVFAVKGSKEIVVSFIRGDLEINEAKLKKVTGLNIVPLENHEGTEIAFGNIGLLNFKAKNTKIIYDISIKDTSNMIIGANKAGYHVTGICVARDLPSITFHDVAKVREGDLCPACGSKLKLNNGIEIGNIFQLGTKYTKAMDMTVLDSNGKPIHPIMGCYGIGVGRAIASIAQESNDARGLILPVSVAPYKVHICPLRLDDENVGNVAYKLYEDLKNLKISTLFDDRNLSAGFKFADADLMGMPLRVVISPKGLAAGEIEIAVRKNSQIIKTSANNALTTIKNILDDLHRDNEV